MTREPTPEMIEAVARAIFEEHNRVYTISPCKWENDPDHWRRYARATLSTRSEGQVTGDYCGIGVVNEGNAPGADRIAGYWARRNKIDNLKFPADWDRHGNSAGPIRNGRMLAEGKPDLVLAFPGGEGTKNMVRQARAAGVPIQHEIPAP